MTAINDKAGSLAGASTERPVFLELGCGSRKTHADAIGVDLLDAPAVDVVGDALEVLRALPEASVARVFSSHFFEHIPDLDAMLTELGRVLTDEGRLEVVVPHFSNPYFYSDPTHTRTFGLYTFAYLADTSRFHRGVPRYGKDFGLVLDDVALEFLSPWPVRNAVRRVWRHLVNASPWCQEFYEENLVYLVPCYELRAQLHRRARRAAP